MMNYFRTRSVPLIGSLARKLCKAAFHEKIMSCSSCSTAVLLSIDGRATAVWESRLSNQVPALAQPKFSPGGIHAAVQTSCHLGGSYSVCSVYSSERQRGTCQEGVRDRDGKS